MSLTHHSGTADSPIARLYGESLSVGEVRGFIHRNSVIDSTQSALMPVGSVLSVSKVLYNNAHPVTSILDIAEGETASFVILHVAYSHFRMIQEML